MSQGAWTGISKPVKLNHRYVSGKLGDMPMYNKSSEKDPGTVLTKKTIIEMNVRIRDPYRP